MKVLVFGGTRFFGKRCVHHLLDEGHEVTILTRGQTVDDFGTKVTRWKGDRTSQDSLKKAIGNSSFDVVIDNICMTASDVEAAVAALGGRVGHYVLTSTLSVYPLGSDLRETDFDASSAMIERPASTPGEIYAQGKRQAEKALILSSAFPSWSIVRIPVVLGEDDYTERLLNQVRRVKSGAPIYYPNLQAKFSFISSADAASALLWLSHARKQGVFNFASREPIVLKDLMTQIEEATGRRAQLVNEPSSEARSPFGVEDDWFMNVDKARDAGFETHPLAEWLPALIKKYASL